MQAQAAGEGAAPASSAAPPSAAAARPQMARRPSQKDGCVPILIHKSDRGFGFNLSRIDGKHVFRVLEPNGAAQKAGASPGDEIVAVRQWLFRGRRLFCGVERSLPACL